MEIVLAMYATAMVYCYINDEITFWEAADANGKSGYRRVKLILGALLLLFMLPLISLYSYFKDCNFIFKQTEDARKLRRYYFRKGN